jgi:tRNA(Ile)-lysidine synthase
MLIDSTGLDFQRGSYRVGECDADGLNRAVQPSDGQKHMDREVSVSPLERALRQRLIETFRKSFSIAPAGMLVGFSGGNDSLALAILLKGTQRIFDVDIRLIHVDHRMRPESGADAEKATALAARVGLPIEVLASNVPPQERFPAVGPEEAARRVRFELLATRARPGDCVALAHHAGDQAETVLLHLLRGSGTDGLAGMSERSELPVPWWRSEQSVTPLHVWRPLLGESKHDLIAVVAARALEAVEDPSNSDEEFRRNVIRRKLLPAMRAIESSVESRLGTLARLAADESAFLESIANDLWGALNAGSSIPRAAVHDAHPAIARRLIRIWLRKTHGYEPTFERVEAIRELSARNSGGATLEVGEHLVVWSDRTLLHVDRRKAKT